MHRFIKQLSLMILFAFFSTVVLGVSGWGETLAGAPPASSESYRKLYTAPSIPLNIGEPLGIQGEIEEVKGQSIKVVEKVKKPEPVSTPEAKDQLGEFRGGPFIKYGIAGISFNRSGLLSGSTGSYGQTASVGVGYWLAGTNGISARQDNGIRLMIEKADYYINSQSNITGSINRYSVDYIHREIFVNSSAEAFIGIGLGYLSSNIQIYNIDPSGFVLTLPIGFGAKISPKLTLRVETEIFVSMGSQIFSSGHFTGASICLNM